MYICYKTRPSVVVAKTYVKLYYNKLFNAVKLLFTNKHGNVIAGIKIHVIEIWTWGQNLKTVNEKFS